MKKISTIVLAAAFLFFMASCNSGGPKKVAEKWLTDFLHLDYESAEQYSTKETINLLKIFKALNEKTISDSARKEAQKIKVDIKDVTEDGDNATVIYTSTIIPEDQTIFLVRQGGEWLVQLTKEDVFKDKEATPVDPDTNPNIVADTTTQQTAGDTSAAQ